MGTGHMPLTKIPGGAQATATTSVVSLNYLYIR